LLALLVVGAVVWIAATSTGPGMSLFGGNEKSGNGKYRIEHLPPNRPNPKETLMDHKKVWLKAGSTVTINVISEQNTDVDCYLDDPSGKQVAQDISFSKDCFIVYQVQQTGYHTIVVDNLGPIANKCTVSYSSAP
jgi:hypothetical protein